MNTEKDNIHDAAAADEQSTIENQNHETLADEVDDNQEDNIELSLQNQLDALNDKYIRLAAEFDNYKRRTSKERVELFSSANRELMTALLPVIDDFDRAFKNTPEERKSSDDMKGFHLIYNKMLETMKQKGLKPMDNTTGSTFDADTMEAITRIPAPSEDLKSKVVDEIERGYMLGDKIVRYAKVVVGE